jgi:Flp pilus assembly protein TadD/uncharacterized membrane protein
VTPRRVGGTVSRAYGLGLAGLVFLVASALYAPTLWGEFVQDDTSLVVQNPLIQSLHRVPDLFVSDYWAPTTKSGLYRPLTTLTYALNFAVAGHRPGPYHAVNVLLHALASALVLLVCLRLTGDRTLALATALLFAVHAVHTEAVNGIVGRAELLSTSFFLCSLLLYLGPDDRKGHPSAPAYLGSLATYALSLLSKENAITLLGVIVCYDVLYRGDPRRRLFERARRVFAVRWRSVYLGFVLVTLGYLALRHLVLVDAALLPPTSRVDNALIELAPAWRVLNALQVALRYLWLLVFPLHLSYDYSYHQIPMLKSLGNPRSLLVFGGIVTALAIGVIAYRRSRTLCFALAFGIVTFSIVSNLVVPIGTLMAERLLYLPSVGFCLALVLVLRALTHRLPLSPRRAQACFWVALAVLVSLHAARTTVRNGDWASQERLLLHDLAVSPASVKVQSNAGLILLAQGHTEESIEHFRRAIEIDPQHGSGYGGLGDALLHLGREKEALEAYEAALQRPLKDALPLNNLGFLLVERGIDVSRGVELLQAAVQISPDNPHFLDSLGWAYFKTGRPREGRELIQRSLALDETGDSGRARRAHLEAIEAELAGPGSLRPAQSPPAR